VRKGFLSLELDDQQVARLLRDVAETPLKAYAAKHSKRLWIDKTPNYARILPFIDRLFQRDAIYIFVVRHPFDSIISLRKFFALVDERYEDPYIRASVASHGKTLRGWARYWREVNEDIRDFTSTHAPRCLTIRYEDFVLTPAPILSNILNFIGVPRAGGDIEQLVCNAFAMRHQLGYGDTKITATNRIHHQSLKKWADWDAARKNDLWEIVGSMANHLGYTLY